MCWLQQPDLPLHQALDYSSQFRIKCIMCISEIATFTYDDNCTHSKIPQSDIDEQSRVGEWMVVPGFQKLVQCTIRIYRIAGNFRG